MANVPNEDTEYELRQRRALVERWAKESQEFLDSYHQRASSSTTGHELPNDALQDAHYPKKPLPHFLCLAPLDGEENRTNRCKWIKLYILSCRLDGEMGHCLEHMGDPHGGIDLNPATYPPRDLSTIQAEMTDVLPWAILEQADLRLMLMTRRGTVTFDWIHTPWFLVTQDDLDTGHITMVVFRRNGEVKESIRRRACNFHDVYLHYTVDCKSLTQIDEDLAGGYEDQNGDLDMNLPVIDILEGARNQGEFLFGFDGGRDEWTEDIEIYAPGYFEMEASGNGADYDHARLINPADAYGIRQRMYEREMEEQQERLAGR